MEYTLWLLIFLVVYTYVGYGVLLALLNIVFTNNRKLTDLDDSSAPRQSLTVVIAAFNEEAFIAEKINNTLSLNYPKDLLNVVVISDGSTDNTNKIVSGFENVTLLYKEAREGKSAALNRAFQNVNSDLVLLTDANVHIEKDALINASLHFNNPKVGIVSGEKKVIAKDSNTSNEGIYWKYESTLKRLDSNFYSAMGAPGEFLLIRQRLFNPIPNDTILDDLEISIRVLKQGYKIVYEPKALAMEYESANIKEEMKRKVRISSGGIQTIARNMDLFNMFKYGRVTFQYISHRVLRWTISPVSLVFILILSLILAVDSNYSYLYLALIVAQMGFYLAAILGGILTQYNIKAKGLNVPFYFCFMNYSLMLGIKKYVMGQTSAIWEKAERGA